MDMPNTLKITVVGGEKNGFEMSFDCSKPVLVGRSRSADLHLPEPDVSGKHFEFVKTESSGCMVRVMSRNGLVVDGRVLNSGDTAYVQANSLIEIGMKAKIRVDAFASGANSEPQSENFSPSSSPMPTANPQTSEDCASAVSAFGDVESTKADRAENKLPRGGANAANDGKMGDSDAETATDLMSAEPPPDSPAPAMSGDDQQSGVDNGSPDAQQGLAGEAEFTNGDTNADPGDSLTAAGEDGETQEMKTRVGSLEEIVERKRQLDRTRTYRRLRFSTMIGLAILSLAGVWLFLNWSNNAIDINGPYLQNGDYDDAETILLNEEGAPEFALVYPRNDAMTVSIAPDSNTVEVATWFGTKRDVPFHLEFSRWNDRADLQRSLEGSFEKWMVAETARGSAFGTQGGNRPVGDFFENAYPGMLEIKTLRGVRFMRSEFTRSRERELWRGNCFYFRKGDRIHLLRLEIPDMFWKIAQRRVSRELHLCLYATFLDDHWDSPGMFGLLDAKLSDDELMSRIRRELSAERVAAWPDLLAYIDTLLVRSWGDKPRIQKEAMSFFLALQDNMAKFYRERELALLTARANGDVKRMKSVLIDCKTAFGALSRDRRSTMVNNPEVWSCRQRRRRYP